MCTTFVINFDVIRRVEHNGLSDLFFSEFLPSLRVSFPCFFQNQKGCGAEKQSDHGNGRARTPQRDPFAGAHGVEITTSDESDICHFSYAN